MQEVIVGLIVWSILSTGVMMWMGRCLKKLNK